MKKNSKIFLTVNFILAFSGCASEPVATKFDANWKFCTPAPSPLVLKPEPMACLYENDVLKLRELLLKCEAKNK